MTNLMTPSDNDSLYHRAAGVISYCLSLLMVLEAIDADEQRVAQKTIDDLNVAETTIGVSLSEVEICALLRQLHRQFISREGESGQRLYALLTRLQAHVGADRYAEYVHGPWPERFKS